MTTSLLGTGSSSSSTTLAITTTEDAPAGSTIVIIVADATLPTSVSTDVSGNAYLLSTSHTNSGGHTGLAIYDSQNIADLPNGSTITVNWSGSSSAFAAVVLITGALTSSRDKAATSGNSSGAASSVATGALTQANEVVIGAIDLRSSPGTLTDGTGFTNLADLNGGKFVVSYESVSSTASVTYNASWTASGEYESCVASYEISGGSAVAASMAMLSGGRGALAVSGAAPGSARLTGKAATVQGQRAIAQAATKASSAARGRGGAPTGAVAASMRSLGVAAALFHPTAVAPLVAATARFIGAAMARFLAGVQVPFILAEAGAFDSHATTVGATDAAVTLVKGADSAVSSTGASDT